MQFFLHLLVNFVGTYAFITHPLVTYGITHADITELAVIRSLARFFYDTRIHPNNNNKSFINEEEYLTTDHTIDNLYKLAYPEYNELQVASYSLPFKFIVDFIITQNVLTDFDNKTKKLSEAHFDNELFINASKRILQFRQIIINNTLDDSEDLTNVRQLLGQSLHTLQDFYSHSNWVEMGKTDINELIGINEIIGTVAQSDQSTCTNDGCTKIEKPCTLWEELTIGICPIVYYDCKNNIRPEINNQQILTSGYTTNGLSENEEVLEKPTNVEKCSHGGILDESSHIPAIVINNTLDDSEDLTNVRQLLGQSLHTLQDFYSHSNWVEMGKTDINELIGINEIIGTVAQPDQSTCTNDGCTKIEKPCTLWEELTIGICPIVYYDCKNNIRPEINNQQILTSGYTTNGLSENEEILEKPTNVEKCSHGGILDESSHIPAIGGINKDSYSLVFSPHIDLHKQAADLAVKATEQYLNDLRRDIGDKNFDRLFIINPTEVQCQIASNSMSQGKRFRFLRPNLSVHLKDDDRWWIKFKRFFKKFFKLNESIWTGDFFTEETINQPTYDLSDQGVNVKDVKNFRAAPYVIGKEEVRRKKRAIDLARKHRYL
ncbi:unnamed protein product [Rotaria sp. Silwood1]|nr:unnamed protein product [Rotaria sp. Silwood1]